MYSLLLGLFEAAKALYDKLPATDKAFSVSEVGHEMTCECLT